MKIFTLVSAVFLAFSPSIALAEGCARGSHSASVECPDGQTWDADAQLCQAGQTS